MKAIQTELWGDGSRGAVTVESELTSLPAQIEELTNAKTRELVLTAAVQAGIRGVPGISRMVDAPYPINADGEDIGLLKDSDGNTLLPPHPRCTPKAYRARYEVTARQ